MRLLLTIRSVISPFFLRFFFRAAMETDVLCLRREWFLAVAPSALTRAVPLARGAKFHYLRQCPIFRHVRSKQLWRWTKSFVESRAVTDEALVAKGRRPRGVFVVCAGRVGLHTQARRPLSSIIFP